MRGLGEGAFSVLGAVEYLEFDAPVAFRAGSTSPGPIAKVDAGVRREEVDLGQFHDPVVETLVTAAEGCEEELVAVT